MFARYKDQAYLIVDYLKGFIPPFIFPTFEKVLAEVRQLHTYMHTHTLSLFLCDSNWIGLPNPHGKLSAHTAMPQ